METIELMDFYYVYAESFDGGQQPVGGVFADSLDGAGQLARESDLFGSGDVWAEWVCGASEAPAHADGAAVKRYAWAAGL